MSRVRVMHVVDSFGTGGTEGGIRKLLSGLDSAVFEQIVCTVAPYRQAEANIETNLEQNANTQVISVGRAEGGRQVLVGKFMRIIAQERPHIVHSRNWGAVEAIPAARLSGVPAVVHSEHGLEKSTYRGQPWRRDVIRRLCFAWADRVFAVSHALRAHYAQQLRVKESRIGVIPNGVDTERFRPLEGVRQAAREKLGVGPDTFVVGTVGRLDPVKDHKTLFGALDLLLALGLRVQLVIVGDGPERKALEAHIRARIELAGRTSFVGETKDIVSQLNSFDVFVLPSLSEGMSNALLEAMSVGVACVATRVGGNPELIEDRSSGVLFDMGDAKTLAGHLKALALDPRFRRDLGCNARTRVEKSFSLHRMLGNYMQLYEDALGSPRSDSAVWNRLVAS